MWTIIKHGLVQMFISVDQLLNVWLFPFSTNTWADETFSSRCGRLQHRRPYVYFAVVANVLFYWQKWDMNHCKRAFEKEKLRYQCPPEMRNITKENDMKNFATQPGGQRPPGGDEDPPEDETPPEDGTPPK